MGTWDDIIMVASAITAMATITTAIVGVVDLCRKKANESAKVIFDLERVGNIIYPVLRNIGRSTAIQIKLTLDNPIGVVEEMGDHDSRPDEHIHDLQLLNNVVSSLRPGTSLREYTGFNVVDFHRRFCTQPHITAKVSFVSEHNGKRQCCSCVIDTAPLCSGWKEISQTSQYKMKHPKES